MLNFKQRQVKLFISSTFRGLYDERDVLANYVFPEISRRCQERKVDFVEIDLRWGIPKEQVKSGEAVPICLARIDEGRPYFLGILGERYGSEMYPEQVPIACDQYPWVEKYQNCSVTELEILHALFPVGQRVSKEERQAVIERALFYFRDSQYALKQPKPDYYLDTPENVEKQNDLKQRIRDLDCPIKEYKKPDDLKDSLIKSLWALIDQDFPEGSQPTTFEIENFEHDVFAESRQRVYIPRPADFKRLTAHALGDSTQPLVILGESGIGKSALLANWAMDYREKYPNDLVFWHFCGSHPASADPIAMLRRLLITLKANFVIENELPTMAEQVIEQLPLWLAQVPQRIVVIFDGLNQLEITPQNRNWLPNFIPAKVRLLVSTIEDMEGDIFTVMPLSAIEQAQLIRQYLARFSRQLDDKYVEKLVSAPQTVNPLYLRVILEELRLFGNFSKLGKRLEYYLEAETIPDLYEKVLARLEKEYQSPEYPNLVSEVLSLLWASRQGLSESELLEMLGTGSDLAFLPPQSPRLGEVSTKDVPTPSGRGLGGGRNPKISQAVWSPLYLALRSDIVNRAGLLNFFHDYLRQAVKNRYLSNADIKKAVHHKLANFFESLPLNARKADEFPYQLAQAGEKERLRDCLMEIPMFVQLMQDGKKYEILAYWVKIGDLQWMAKVYWDKITSLAIKSIFYRLGRFLHIVKPNSDLELFPEFQIYIFDFLRTARTNDEDIEPIYRMQATLLKWIRPKHKNTAVALDKSAKLLQDKGDYKAAEPLLRRALAISEQVSGAQHPDTAQSLNNLANLLKVKGDYEEAEPLHRRALAISEQVLGAQHPTTAISLNNLASLLQDKGNYEATESLYRRALAIREQVSGTRHPDTATLLNNLAGLLQNKGDYEAAEPLYRRALSIKEQTLGAQHTSTATSLNNLAELLRKKGDYEASEPLYRRALAISEQVLGAQHPNTATSLNNLALLLSDKGNYVEAEPLCRRALAIAEKVLGNEHPYTILYRKNLDSLLEKKTKSGFSKNKHREYINRLKKRRKKKRK